MQVYLGIDHSTYLLAAFKPGPAGSMLTLHMDTVKRGRWVMITRSIPNSVLIMCEVKVLANRRRQGISCIKTLSTLPPYLSIHVI